MNRDEDAAAVNEVETEILADRALEVEEARELDFGNKSRMSIFWSSRSPSGSCLC